MESSNTDVDRLVTFFKTILGIIVVLGIVMVYSASYMYAKEKYGSSIYFFLRQSSFVAIALVFSFIVAKTKINFWLKYSLYIHWSCVALLLLTLIPGVGIMTKGANRWIAIGGFSIQPGEFIKYSILLVSINFFENYGVISKKNKIKISLALITPLLLLLLQPDFGTFSICFVLMAFVCFLSSFPRKYFYSLLGSGLILSAVILVARPYRVKRLMAFLDPWENSKGSGFQIIQSWIGFANGSIFGRGPGNSLEKLFFLPEAHNDFIFSVIGEELGFFGVLCVVVLFGLLVYYGFKLSLLVSEKVPHILMASVIFLIGFQAVLNMSVVLGLLPTKGLNLPFISYGGSSLLANFLGIGLVFSVLRQSMQNRTVVKMGYD